MSNAENIPATIAEQIYTLMLTNLAYDEAFDEASLSRLQALVDRNRLSNRKAVLDAIQVQPEATS